MNFAAFAQYTLDLLELVCCAFSRTLSAADYSCRSAAQLHVKILRGARSHSTELGSRNAFKTPFLFFCYPFGRQHACTVQKTRKKTGPNYSSYTVYGNDRIKVLKIGTAKPTPKHYALRKFPYERDEKSFVYRIFRKETDEN